MTKRLLTISSRNFQTRDSLTFAFGLMKERGLPIAVVDGRGQGGNVNFPKIGQPNVVIPYDPKYIRLVLEQDGKRRVEDILALVDPAPNEIKEHLQQESGSPVRVVTKDGLSMIARLNFPNTRIERVVGANYKDYLRLVSTKGLEAHA